MAIFFFIKKKYYCEFKSADKILINTHWYTNPQLWGSKPLRPFLAIQSATILACLESKNKNKNHKEQTFHVKTIYHGSKHNDARMWLADHWQFHEKDQSNLTQHEASQTPSSKQLEVHETPLSLPWIEHHHPKN